MLQNTEYYAAPYVAWFWRTTDFSKVTYRRTLDFTRPARLLLLALRLGMALQVVAGLMLLWLAYARGTAGAWQFGLALVLSYPIVWAHLVAVPLVLGRWLVIRPKQLRLIKKSEQVFKSHNAVRLAIAGSYGKTSMKELLLTVLSEGKKVAATPANKNVAISHAYFAHKLAGDEDVIIIEYGEGAPGDVARFARITHPTHAIITGVAPAHLDRYKTVERAAQDIFSITEFVKAENIYANAESPLAGPFISKKTLRTYDQHGALGWKVSNIHVAVTGVSFTVKKGSRSIKLHSGLIGRHQVGPLTLAAALAAEFGLTNEQIAQGIAKSAPFEHRMQPYNVHGAWIIDDTYNGNIEGVRVGTSLLKELTASRKLYVTPGLVDQGKEAQTVHREMGRLIAQANPDIVVLMQNSATVALLEGLKEANFQGKTIVEDDPLGFYTNIQAFVAAGDVVLMQNDWTDNYA